MTRTRSEVKLGLTAFQRYGCDECPYLQDTGCYDEVIRDALEYIMEMEAEVRELKGGNAGGVEEDDSGFASSVTASPCHLPQEGKALEENGKEE